ncbi:hypothetical protein AALH30_02830 [Blautia pseudococcoides]|uniref:hypothetical protein n=1 Tax=Blautia pseudococcoides TaxID=1796616 RepID=UPI00148AF48C|nr:hypothetical protein [Blautia pseudococcoides]QJU13723.1 hypothetical protein HL650_04120 [Blautia pseudococcoides]
MAEHGLSVVMEERNRKFLMDTGQSEDREIAPGFWVIGNIPYRTDFESHGDSCSYPCPLHGKKGCGNDGIRILGFLYLD